MSIPAPLNSLIHSIYQGVLEEQPWSHFLKLLNGMFDGDSATIFLEMSEGKPAQRYLLNRIVSNKTDEEGLSSRWVALDPFQDIVLNKPELLDDMGFQEPIEQTRLFKDLIEPSGKRYILAINIVEDENPGLILKLRIARRPGKGNFSVEDKNTITFLIKHLQLALTFFDQKVLRQQERNAYVDVINQFMLGTLIVDYAGKILVSNQVACDILERYPVLNVRNETLVFADNLSNRQFHEALRNINLDTTNNRLIPTTLSVNLGGQMSLGIMIRPVRSQDDASYPLHSHAAIYMSDPRQEQGISPQTLKELFGFTGKESTVAAYLANGYSLDEIAETLSISINTAKTHARVIYDKAGVNKQTKFIQLIANSVARV